MKKYITLIVKGMFILLLFSFNAMAQHKDHAKNKFNHDLADNKLLHATEITLAPGEKTDLHTHPAHFFYALTDGKLMVHHQNGKDELLELKAGDSGTGDPEGPHITENVGTATVKFLLVELKEHPYKDPKAKK